ncbi:tetratricopeptide repeat protein [Amycolatopsis magusensis]|uniref:tetratricopeptide repeat protein n=1 Tax=Amycolatopsis magusensis TaxID=882444 RepID=UPI00378FCE83
MVTRGELNSAVGWWASARADFDRAEALAQQLDNTTLSLSVLNARGLLLLEQGHFDAAVRWLDRALPLSRGIDRGRSEAMVVGNLGNAHLGLGHCQLALEHGERGLHLRRQAGDLPGEAWALTQQARVWQALGDFNQAIALCRNAITIGHNTPLSRSYTVAQPLDVLASCLHQLGRTSEAITC